MPVLPGFRIRFSETTAPDAPPASADTADLVAASHGSSRAWCFGELISYRSGRDTKTSLIHVLSDWEAGRLDCQRLNGRFVLLIQNGENQQWEIITDRMGAMHVYARYTGDRIAEIASDLALLASPCEYDWVAIACFFTFGFFPKDRTYYTNVRIFLPRSRYRFAADGTLIEHAQYWHWHHTVDEQRSYDDTVAEYHYLLRCAVERCSTVGQLVLPISGGLDSRSLAAVIAPGTQSYSYGYTVGSIETRIARQVAKARDLPFTAHVISPYLFGRIQEIALALHGSQDLTHARQCSITEWLDEHADAVLTGLAGDVWNDQLGLADGLPENTSLTDYLARKLFRRGHKWLLKHVIPIKLLDVDLYQIIRGFISDQLAELEHIEDLDFRAKAYKASTWIFRWSNASLRGFALAAAPRIPYYDVDMIDFLCTIPTAFVRDRRLQIDYLKRYAPELARIRWQAAEANLYLAKYGWWLSLPQRSLARASQLLRQQRPIQRNWEVQFLQPRARQQLENWLHTLTPEVCTQDAVQGLLDDFYRKPDPANSHAMSMLLTFAAWRTASKGGVQ